MTRPHITFLQLRDSVRVRLYRSPSALKVTGCNKPIGTYFLHVSDFYINDLRSGPFLDLPIISQWGKIRWLIFSQILVVITKYGWHHCWPSWHHLVVSFSESFVSNANVYPVSENWIVSSSKNVQSSHFSKYVQNLCNIEHSKLTFNLLVMYC